MRTRINRYEVQGRQINTFMPNLTIEDIRLIVNEDKKIVITSSMQKDNIIVEGGVIYYSEAIAESDTTDAMTIEIDLGTIDTTLYSPCDLDALDAWWAEQSTDKEIIE